jgi:hypothetical protein
MRYLIFILLLLLSFSGCSNNNPQGRVPIRGEVTLDGNPLEKGEISFRSVEGSKPLVATGAQIKDGKFSLQAKDGLIPEQTYLVQFRSIEVIPPDEHNESAKPQVSGAGHSAVGGFALVKTRNLLPNKYDTPLKDPITATKKSPNVFKFDLTSDKK